MAYSFQKDLRYSKNPYLQYGDTAISSVDEQEIPVNSTIKPIDREDANMEVEKNELILKPDGTINKALGKFHTGGGTPVNLPEGSFVYSQYKPLSISKQDKELFELKKGGKNNTPAKVLGREVDIKHHNKMIAIGDSNKHDVISKKSAELMLQKNFKKVGQVAYLQEEAKDFPDGLPNFSEGTAPVQDPEQEQQQVMSKQFMQLGGKVWQGDKYGSRRRGTLTSNGTKYSQEEWDNFAKELGYKGDILGFQNLLHKNPEYAPIIDNLHTKYKPGPNKGIFDGKIGYRWDAIMNQYRHPKVSPETVRPNRDYNPAPELNKNPSLTINPYVEPDLNTKEEPNIPVLPYKPNIGLTPSQKLDLGNSLYNAVSINKYAPKRAQVNFTPVNLERDNVQPYLNNIDNNIQQGYKATSTMNPIVARAQNSQMFGRGLEAKSQARGQVFARNSQISNQENLYNNQGLNKTGEQNVQLDNTYYNQLQALNQNYDNESRFARNQVADKYLKHIGDNQALSMGIMSQPFGTIDKTDANGNPYKQAAPLWDFNFQRGHPYYTGAAMSLDQLPTGQSGVTDALSRSLFEKYQNGTITADELKTLGYLTNGQQKLQARVRNPYR